MEAVVIPAKLTVPEAARRLQMAGGEVYRLIFSGMLPGHPERDGAVYIAEQALEEFLAAQRAEGSVPRQP